MCHVPEFLFMASGVPMSKVTKAELIDSLLDKTDLNRKDIHEFIDLFIETLKDALCEGHSIELRGFGTFEIRKRKGRSKARNPKTGEMISVRDHGVAVFRPGKELKQKTWNILPDKLDNDQEN